MSRAFSMFVMLVLGIGLGFGAARFFTPLQPVPLSRPPRAGAPEAGMSDDITRETASPEAPSAAISREREPAPRDATVPVSTAALPAVMHLPGAAAEGDGTVRIPRKFLGKINCMVINTASNVLADDVVELMGISPDERSRLNALIASIRERVEDRELERAVVTEQTPGRVTLKIAGLPDRAQETEDAFTTGVRETLGDQADAFLERFQPYATGVFGGYGRFDTTLVVTRDERSGLLRVESRQEYTTPQGGRGTVATAAYSSQVPDRWKKFFQP